MKFMNEYDLMDARRRFNDVDTPNRFKVVLTIVRLATWTNNNSDGWAYWQKPLRAAQKAITLVESGTWEENEHKVDNDATDAEVKAALAPIKAFLTRQGVDHSEVL